MSVAKKVKKNNGFGNLGIVNGSVISSPKVNANPTPKASKMSGASFKNSVRNSKRSIKNSVENLKTATEKNLLPTAAQTKANLVKGFNRAKVKATKVKQKIKKVIVEKKLDKKIKKAFVAAKKEVGKSTFMQKIERMGFGGALLAIGQYVVDFFTMPSMLKSIRSEVKKIQDGINNKTNNKKCR